MDPFLRGINKIKQNREDGSLQVLENLIDLVMSYLASETFAVDVLKYQLNLLSKSFSEFVVLHQFVAGIELSGTTKKEISSFISGYKQTWNRVDEKISNHFLNNIEVNDSAILLHSNSRTIHALFEGIARRNLRVDVFQTESLPGGEGILQAGFVKELGFDVFLIKDEEVSTYLNNIDLFLIGADRIEPENIINKVGSEAIAKLFIDSGKQVYVLADSRKITKSVSPVLGVLFEKIPRNFITEIITENG
jgi:translation initiation factor 2B subunit (eIF-2B alpha/beta/delta family)